MTLLKKIILRVTNLKETTILITLMCVSVFLGILSIWDMPLYSDSAFHGSQIREIIRSGNFPIISPVGWVDPALHPLSAPPFLTHPPLYYIANAFLVSFGIDIPTALSITAIVPATISVYFFYKLIAVFFDKKIAMLSAVLLVFAPMTIWLISHRIMEPLQYSLSICALYYVKKFTDNKNYSNLFLGGIFSVAILYIKITSLFIIVPIGLYLIARRASWKHLLIFSIIISMLYSPYLAFAASTRGTIAYAEPGFPILDDYFFKPWWRWEKTPEEEHLNKISSFEPILDKLKTNDQKKRSYIHVDFLSFNFDKVIQNYNAYAVTDRANDHWFSPNKTYAGIYLILFFMGIFFYAKKYTKSKFHYLILPLIPIITLYLIKAGGDLRYFFILNILLIVLYAIGIKELYQVLSNKYKAILLSVFIVSLAAITYSELLHSYIYKYSLRHNPLPEGQGIVDINNIDVKLLNDPRKNIFTPATSEVSYYLDRKIVADYRLFFISEDEVDRYLNIYKVSLIIIPKFFLTDTTYSFTEEEEVSNIQKYWEGITIPKDSGFYQYINDPERIELTKDIGSIMVYKRKPI